MPTAILVDGGFFIRRYPKCYGGMHSAQQIAKTLYTMCFRHLEDKKGNRERELYRIFFYDCPPSNKKAHHPITRRLIDFSKLPGAVLRTELHRELIRLRKVALRLGTIADRNAKWMIRAEKTRQLLKKEIAVDELDEEDLYYSIKQKGVDMRIALDIASLAFKRLVDQIVLVSGDSDFVPAAKLARREGIDFILDPMWQKIRDDLFEHIDGLRSTCPRPGASRATATLTNVSGPIHEAATDTETSSS